jgi:hypothetical protein
MIERESRCRVLALLETLPSFFGELWMFLCALQQAFDAEVAVERFPMERVRADFHRAPLLFQCQQEHGIQSEWRGEGGAVGQSHGEPMMLMVLPATSPETALNTQACASLNSGTAQTASLTRSSPSGDAAGRPRPPRLLAAFPPRALVRNLRAGAPDARVHAMSNSTIIATVSHISAWTR